MWGKKKKLEREKLEYLSRVVNIPHSLELRMLVAADIFLNKFVLINNTFQTTIFGTNITYERLPADYSIISLLLPLADIQ